MEGLIFGILRYYNFKSSLLAFSIFLHCHLKTRKKDESTIYFSCMQMDKMVFAVKPCKYGH